jgi:D-amino-acid dehydrogenase
MEQLDLIVIGAGISGVALATRAAADGLRVAVIEQHATVAQGASFAHSGLMYPSPLDPWFGPGPQAPVEGGLPWRRKTRQINADVERIKAFTALTLLANRSRDALAIATQTHQLECEAREGALYLFRSAHTLARAQALGPALTEAGIGHRFIDADACRTLEPALAHADDLAGAVLLEQVWSGNCALAAKRLKASLSTTQSAIRSEHQVEGLSASGSASGNVSTTEPTAASTASVEFLLARKVIGMQVGIDHVEVEVRPAMQAAGAFSGVQAKGFTMPSSERLLKVRHADQDATQRLRARHVVVAAGSGSAEILATANIALPFMPIVSSALTGLIRHDHYAPRRMLVDAERGVGIVRFEHRLRAGIAVAGRKHGTPATKRAPAGRTVSAKRLEELEALLHACAEHRIPGAANLNREAGTADHAIGADAEPIIGTIAVRANAASSRGMPLAAPVAGRSLPHFAGPLHISLPGTYRGWALAFGAAEIILDSIQGLPGDPAFDRFSPRRFG